MLAVALLAGCGGGSEVEAIDMPPTTEAEAPTTATPMTTTTTERITTTTTIDVVPVVTRLAPEVVATLTNIRAEAAEVRNDCSIDPAGSVCSFGLMFDLLGAAADAARLGGLLTQVNPDPSYSTPSPFLVTQAAITGVIDARDEQLACDPRSELACVVEQLALMDELEYLGSQVEDWSPYL